MPELRTAPHLGALLILLLTACSASAESRRAFDEGTKLWNQGKEEDAIKTFEKGIVAAPEHFDMRLSLARILYEKGERPHLEQRRLLVLWNAALDRKDEKAARQFKDQAEGRRTDAALHYRGANLQLDAVLAACKVDQTLCHAAVLRFRTAMFFEDFELARKNVKLILERAKLEGSRRAKYESFLETLDRETPKPLMPRKES